MWLCILIITGCWHNVTETEQSRNLRYWRQKTTDHLHKHVNISGSRALSRGDGTTSHFISVLFDTAKAMVRRSSNTKTLRMTLSMLDQVWHSTIDRQKKHPILFLLNPRRGGGGEGISTPALYLGRPREWDAVKGIQFLVRIPIYVTSAIFPLRLMSRSLEVIKGFAKIVFHE